MSLKVDFLNLFCKWQFFCADKNVLFHELERIVLLENVLIRKPLSESNLIKAQIKQQKEHSIEFSSKWENWLFQVTDNMWDK